ncbi:MAG: hypothetical protein H0W48_01095 [Methylibium sp.]|nr:hypothetical protein [Methylibium sp.]
MHCSPGCMYLSCSTSWLIDWLAIFMTHQIRFLGGRRAAADVPMMDAVQRGQLARDQFVGVIVAPLRLVFHSV